MVYKVLYFVVLTLGLLALVAASEVQLSPIKIDPTNTKSDPTPVNINSPQAPPVKGSLENTGGIIKFVPVPASSRHNLLGSAYILKEIVFHWGSTSSVGSEHQVGDGQFSAEIQFVHFQPGASAYSIVAVLCDAVSGSSRGVWDQLDSIPATGSSQVRGIISYADLLPGSQGYYRYIGSHTISPYVDVEWFVMKQSIEIPNVFLNSLRNVQPFNHASPTSYNPQVYEFP